MKFTLHRKPDSKAQKIPFPAMQIAGLADAEALVLRAEEGCILLARDSLSTREIVKVIAFLDGGTTGEKKRRDGQPARGR